MCNVRVLTYHNNPEQLSPADQTVIDTVETPQVKLGIAAMLAGGLSYSKNKANNTTSQKKKVTTAIASMMWKKKATTSSVRIIFGILEACDL
jgi:hypothetical protein